MEKRIYSIFTLPTLRQCQTHTPITHINLNMLILFYRSLSICTHLLDLVYTYIRFKTFNMSFYFVHAKSKNQLIIISGTVYILIASIQDTFNFPLRLMFQFPLFSYRNVWHSMSWIQMNAIKHEHIKSRLWIHFEWYRLLWLKIMLTSNQ